MKLIDNKILLFGLPFKSKEFGTIHQLKLRDFLEFDYINFKSIFTLRKDLFFDEDSKDYDSIKDLDILFLTGQINRFIEALKLLYKTEEIKLDTKHNDVDSIKIIIKQDNNEYIINRENYTEFANIILILLHEGNNIADKEVRKDLDETELLILKRRKAFERKQAKKEAELRKQSKEEPMSIFDIANYIIHCDNKFDYQSVLDLTIYQLINSCNIYTKKENYGYSMDYRTSGQFKIEDKLNHWFFDK